MHAVLLIDFGSTFTKVTAVDVDEAKLLGAACAPTTARTDIQEGLDAALSLLERTTGPLEFTQRLACSSAAGGLRMAASGLVPELTARAARTASLGAGAKVVGVFSFELTQGDLQTISDLHPDVFLLAGGTDGGNTACVVHNAQMLSRLDRPFPVVYAGNRAAWDDCARILTGWDVTACENVMPRFGELNVEPAQDAVRALFLRRIVGAKGMTRTKSLLSGILMPTPAAVLGAMELLSGGHGDAPGIGALLGVDVGGATTDVYSIADGRPQRDGTVYKGLPEPFAKRTVEGDIGMRYGAAGVLEAAGEERLAAISQLSAPRMHALLDSLSGNAAQLGADADDLSRLDHALAALAVETAVLRHAGTMTQAYTMMGPVDVQTGKDLRETQNLVLTGGSLIRTARPDALAKYALYSPDRPESLRPQRARVLVDRSYLLAAMGLLAQHYPAQALQIMKKELLTDGNSEL